MGGGGLKARYEELSMGPPSKSDYADQSAGHGIVFRYFSGDGDYDPHYKSGADGDKLTFRDAAHMEAISHSGQF